VLNEPSKTKVGISTIRPLGRLCLAEGETLPLALLFYRPTRLDA
jgi:hypothetical protein